METQANYLLFRQDLKQLCRKETWHNRLNINCLKKERCWQKVHQLEQELVIYALEELDGHFTLSKLYDAFSDRISRRRLSQLAQQWEEMELLTTRPRRVTYAMRALVEAED